MAQVAIDVIDLVDKVLTQIRTATGLAATNVYTVPDENAELAVKKNVQVVTVALTSFLPDVGQQTGGAAYQLTFNQTWRTVFVVNVWNSFFVDQVGQNDKWLRDTSRGILPLFMKVFKGLEQYFPLDASNNQMLEQPMRLSPGGFSFVPTPALNSIARIRAEFEASFIIKLPS